MSDRQAFWGVYLLDNTDNDDFICLCKDEATAQTVAEFMTTQEWSYEVRHVEIVANVDLNLEDY